MDNLDKQILHRDPVLAEMVQRLATKFNPERIYIYGSRARSEEGPDSDYDLMMVVSSSSLPKYKREQLAFRTLMGIGVPKEIIVLTRMEFDSKRSVICSLAATVEREGKLLYAA